MDVIQQIKDNISVKQLAEVLGLRRNGKLYYCVNPYHKDDTPSLSINDRDNYFKCFGCGCGSDVIDLYCYYNGLDKTNKEQFKDALKGLCQITGINYDESVRTTDHRKSAGQPVQRRTVKPLIKRETQYNFLCDYDAYYFDERAGIYEYGGGNDRETSERLALMHVRNERLQRNKIIFNELYTYCIASGMDDKVYKYLRIDRRLSDDVIKQSRLFSINDISETTKHLLKLFDLKELQGTGLFNDNRLKFDNSYRLIIPYIENNEITYLRARYFDPSGNTGIKRSKYNGLSNDSLNLNRTKRFYNVDTLYKADLYSKIYLCEGEFDALSLESIGLNAVAIAGTGSIPPEQDFKVFGNNHVVLCFDNDKPGQDATVKAEEILIRNDIYYTVQHLPDGVKDINEFLIIKLKNANKTTDN